MTLLIETGLVVAILVIVHIAIYQWVSKKSLRSIRDRHVVITGGSQGIGFWIAVNCVKLGAHVTIIARSVEKLESALEKIKLHRVNDKQLIQYRSIDLSKSYDSVKNALSALEEDIAPIYMLVNCAGGAICGRVDEISPDDAVYLMNINYYSVYYPTRYVLMKFKETGDGIITITASQASLVGIYGYGPYAAAKFALRGLAETIAMEVSNTNISITLALPADTDTPGFENENRTKPEETKIISGGGGLAKPENMAQKILTDSLSGHFISISGFKSWILTIICSGMMKVNLTTIFGANKNRDRKSKLAMMLSFLRGDESKVEVDSVRKTSIGVEKSDQKEETKTSIVSTSANLSTITSVTFSTATTTSVLNVPSDATKSSIVEPRKSENKDVSASDASSTTVTGFTLSTTVSSPSSTIVTPTVTSQNDKPQTSTDSAIKTVPSPTVTFNLPTTTSPTIAATSTPATTSDSAPRLGGFSFSATSPPTFTSSLAAKPAITEAVPTSKVEETKAAAPTFSFGLAKSTGNTTLPSFVPPTFGSNTQAKTETTTTLSSSVLATSAPPAYNFGSPATKPPALPANTGISFGIPSSSVASTTTNTLGTSSTGTSLFGFGAVAKTTTPSAATVTSTPATNAFVFGSGPGANATATPAPTFGLTNTNVTTASGTTTSNQAPFSFGATANTSKPETGAFQFGNTTTNATTSPLTFGSPSPSAGTAAPSTGLFGTANTTNPTTTTQSAFGAFGANKPNADAKPLFGTATTQPNSFGSFSAPKFGDKNATSTFGGISSSTVTATSSTSIFGSSQAAPVFGTATDQNANTPVLGSQNQTNTIGKPTMATNPSQESNSAFGSQTTGGFAFGQNASQPPATTASTGVFGTSNTNTTPDSAFGNQAETKPAPFSFSSNIGSSFSFGSANSQPETAKPFNFGGPATAPAAVPTSFSFNASLQPPANTSSIRLGSGTNIVKTGRPMRTSVRRMK